MAGTADQSSLKAQRARQRGGAVKSFLVFLAGLAILTAIALGVGGYVGYRAATGPGPLTESKIVLLPSGSAVSRIAR